MTIITNENKKVSIDANLYNELQSDFNSGVWMAIIKVDGKVHNVILPQNFN